MILKPFWKCPPSRCTHTFSRWESGMLLGQGGNWCSEKIANVIFWVLKMAWNPSILGTFPGTAWETCPQPLGAYGVDGTYSENSHLIDLLNLLYLFLLLSCPVLLGFTVFYFECWSHLTWSILWKYFLYLFNLFYLLYLIYCIHSYPSKKKSILSIISILSYLIYLVISCLSNLPYESYVSHLTSPHL